MQDEAGTAAARKMAHLERKKGRPFSFLEIVVPHFRMDN
jgi:hypothetical protein